MKFFHTAVLTMTLLAAASGFAEVAATPKSIVDRVASIEGSLAWDIFRLGMKLEEIQTLLEKEIPLNPGSEGDPTINRYAVDLTHRGVALHLAFESDEPSAALTYIRASFPRGIKADVPSLAASLASRIPGLARPEGSDALILEGSDYQTRVKDDGVELGATWLF